MIIDPECLSILFCFCSPFDFGPFGALFFNGDYLDYIHREQFRDYWKLYKYLKISVYRFHPNIGTCGEYSTMLQNF